jgi:hypothetical protein
MFFNKGDIMPKKYKGKIRSNDSAHANLPMYAMFKEYPDVYSSASSDLNQYDDVGGIDMRIKMNSKGRKSGMGDSW